MRTYRFVRFLGDRVEEASQAVAANLKETRSPDERLMSDDEDPHRRVRRELPRAIASHVDGTSKRNAEFRARTVAPDGRSTESTNVDRDMAVIVHASVPNFEQVSAILAKPVDVQALKDPEFSLAEIQESASLERMLSLTADAFVFVVGEKRVHVVPAQSVAALTDPIKRKTPHRELYSRQLGRFFEEFAEGFVGDGRLAPDLSRDDSRADADSRILSWAESHGIGRVVLISVSMQSEETEATLRDFADSR